MSELNSKSLSNSIITYVENQIEVMKQYNQALFDLSKMPISIEKYSDDQIQSVTESFDNGFETTLKYVPMDKQIIVVSIETNRVII